MGPERGDGPPYFLRRLVAAKRSCGEVSYFVYNVDHRPVHDELCVNYHPVIEVEVLAADRSFESSRCCLVVLEILTIQLNLIQLFPCITLE